MRWNIRLWPLFLSVFGAYGAVFLAPACVAQTTPPEATAALISRVAAAASAIPADQRDAVALAERLRTLPEAFRWVHAKTTLTPYRGLLKGAAGVLQDRAGNSLDRSLLFAEMASALGQEVRLVRARLDPQAAELFLAGVSSATVAAPSDVDVDALLGDLTTAVGTALPAEAIAGVFDETERVAALAFDHAERLTAALEADVSPRLTEPASQRRARERAMQVDALRDHWWTQVRIDGVWVDHDATFEAPGRARSSVFEIVPITRIPQVDQHLIDIALLIESVDPQGRLRQDVVLTESFSANELAGQPVRLSIEPLDLPRRDELGAMIAQDHDPAKIAERARRWLPVLEVGERTFTQSMFDLEGETGPATGGYLETLLLGTGVQRATERALGQAADGLAGLGAAGTASDGESPEGRGPRVLSGAWLRLTHRAPDSTPRVHWRALYDRFDRPGALPPQKPASPVATPSAQESLRRMLALSGDVRILIETAKTTPTQQLVLAAKRLDASRGVLIQLAGGSLRSDAETERASRATLRANIDLVAVATARWGLNVGSDEVFQNRPTVLLSQRGHILPRGETEPIERLTIDFLENRVGVYSTSDSDPLKARLAQGIADTVAEASMVSTSFRLGNTAIDHLSDMNQNRDWQWVSASGDWDTKLSVAEREHLRRDLDAGAMVFAPPRDRGRLYSWWRIDPATGDTLGMLGSGGGAVIAEHISFMLRILTANTCFAIQHVFARTGERPFKPGAYLACMIGAGLANVGLIGEVLWLNNLGVVMNLVGSVYAALPD